MLYVRSFLFISYAVVSIFSRKPCLPPISFVTVSLSSMSVNLFCFVTVTFYIIFLRFHIQGIAYDVCLSLSDFTFNKSGMHCHSGRYCISQAFKVSLMWLSTISLLHLPTSYILFIYLLFYFTILYWFCHTLT